MNTDRILATVSVACALILTGVVVLREFRRGDGGSTAPDAGYQVVEDWKGLMVGRDLYDSAPAPVSIVVFGDFQCPGCRKFAMGSLRGVMSEHGGEVRVLFRHWPLEPIHPHAYRAAKAAECAGAQGRFPAMHDALFEHQADIGRKRFSELAAVAGVRDSIAFRKCLAVPDRDPNIDRDSEAAMGLALQGTPSVVVNGRLLLPTPDSATFVRLVSQEVRRVQSGQR